MQRGQQPTRSRAPGQCCRTKKATRTAVQPRRQTDLCDDANECAAAAVAVDSSSCSSKDAASICRERMNEEWLSWSVSLKSGESWLLLIEVEIDSLVLVRVSFFFGLAWLGLAGGRAL